MIHCHLKRDVSLLGFCGSTEFLTLDGDFHPVSLPCVDQFVFGRPYQKNNILKVDVLILYFTDTLAVLRLGR